MRLWGMAARVQATRYPLRALGVLTIPWPLPWSMTTLQSPVMRIQGILVALGKLEIPVIGIEVTMVIQLL